MPSADCGADGGSKSRDKPRHGAKQSYVLILDDRNAGESGHSVTYAPMAYKLCQKRVFNKFNKKIISNKDESPC